MTTTHIGNNYYLIGNSQSIAIDNTSGAMGFIYGSNDTIDDNFSPGLNLHLYGSNEQILQYGGTVSLTIEGFNVTDSLSVYGLFEGPGGVPLPRGSGPDAALLKSDGHGGWVASLAYQGGSIDFVSTSRATILAAHIVGSVR